jgi:putative tricarboxylic transport membrane protein
MPERLVALALLVASGGYLFLSLPLPRGTAARPGPGFFPFAIGTFLCVVSVSYLVASFRGATGVATAAAPIAPEARRRVLAAAATLVAACVLMPLAGYPIVAFLFVAVLLRALGGRQWVLIGLTALVSAAASYYLFAVLLGVPLPRGPWPE